MSLSSAVASNEVGSTTFQATEVDTGEESKEQVVGQTVFSGVSQQVASEDITKYQLGEILGRGSFSLILLSMKKTGRDLIVLKVTKFKDKEGNPIPGAFYNKQHKASLLAQSIPNNPLIMKTYKSFVSFQKVSALNNCFSRKDLTRDVVNFFGSNSTLDGFYFEECELLRGRELFETIVKGGLSEDQVQFILASVVLMLKHLKVHRVAHRDIKPENLVFDEKGNLKLVDFGLAKKFNVEEILRTTTCCGSPQYAAPELVLKESDGDYAAFPVDVWSLGITIYCSSSGYLPFSGATFIDLAQSVTGKQASYSFSCFQGKPESFPVRVKECLQGMLEKNPNTRLTVEDVEQHKALNEMNLNTGMNWKLLEEGHFISPFLPEESPLYIELKNKEVVPWENRTTVMPFCC
jgi:serine/threonine protein kinase